MRKANTSNNTARRFRKIDKIVTYISLVVLCVVWLIPIVWVIATSFRGESTGLITQSFFPKEWTLDNYINLFEENRVLLFGKWVGNTLKIAIINTIGTTLFTLCTAYSLSRFRFKMRRPFMNISLILGMFPGFMAMSAIYIILSMVKINGESVLIGNTWSLLIIYMAGAGLGFFVSKGYFDTIPNSLNESAYVDGASQWTTFFKIILPLAKPIIIYTALMAFMAPWTDYVLANLILGADRTRESWTVAIGLYNLTEEARIADYFTIFSAGCVLIAVPIVALYLALQRYMVEGISAGAVKG